MTKTVYVVQSCRKEVAFQYWNDRITHEDLDDAKAYKKASELNSVNNWRIIKRTEEVIHE